LIAIKDALVAQQLEEQQPVPQTYARGTNTNPHGPELTAIFKPSTIDIVFRGNNNEEKNGQNNKHQIRNSVKRIRKVPKSKNDADAAVAKADAVKLAALQGTDEEGRAGN